MLFVAAGTIVLQLLLIHIEIVACQLLPHLLLFTVIALLFLIHADDLIGFLLRNEAAAVAVDSWICHVVFADDVSVLTLAM